jgi:hypothetical protein
MLVEIVLRVQNLQVIPLVVYMAVMVMSVMRVIPALRVLVMVQNFGQIIQV